MSGTLKISFTDLAVARGSRRPLGELSLDDHIHGHLLIEVAGRRLPHLGYSGENDVCMGEWLNQLAGVREAFASSSSGRYKFDEGEQGQPAYIFEREGDLAYLTIGDAEFSGGCADLAWQRVEFHPTDLVAEVDRLRQAFVAHLVLASPTAARPWLAAHIGERGPTLGGQFVEELVH